MESVLCFVLVDEISETSFLGYGMMVGVRFIVRSRNSLDRRGSVVGNLFCDLFRSRRFPTQSFLGSGMTVRMRFIVCCRHSLERRRSVVGNLFGNKKRLTNITSL